MKIVVGITGASGSIYGITLIKALAGMEIEVHGIITDMGEKVMGYECNVKKEELNQYVTWHPINDLFAPVSSGSFKTDAMVIVPCSMNTLGLLASGSGSNLLCRAAGVTMKESRKLVIVPREMPYSIIYLENMLRLARAGAVILPASPGFYHKPQSVEHLVNHVVGKILDAMSIDNELFPRWEGM